MTALLSPSPHEVGRGRGPARKGWEGEVSFRIATLAPLTLPSPPADGGRGKIFC